MGRRGSIPWHDGIRAGWALDGLEPSLLDTIEATGAFELFLTTDVERAIRVAERDACFASNDDDEDDEKKEQKEQGGE